MQTGLRQRVVHNLGIKIASVILALAVYLHVYSIQDRTIVMAVPLAIEGLPRGLTYRGEVPRQIRVRFRGPGGDLFKLRTEPVKAVVRLSQPRIGDLQRPVTTADVELPSKSGVTIEGLAEPTTLSLTIEPTRVAVLPVAVQIRGLPAPGFVRYGTARAWPETLRVTGPAGLVAAIDSIRTEDVDVSGRSGTVGETIRLRSPEEGVRIGADRVSVRIPIVPLLRRSFGPMKVSLPPELRGSWAISPESVRVQLAGPQPLLESLSEQDLRPRAVPTLPVGSDDSAPVQAGLPPALRGTLEVEAVEPATVFLVRKDGRNGS